ncbi:MAG: hypothetical protein Q9174_007040, partial [Haloplaca sp. 1 TL-2023]
MNPVNGSSNVPAERPESDLVTHTLNLDSHELFTQLSVTAALVTIGPRRGVFLSFIDVVDKKTPRIWRDWLAQRDGKDAGESQYGVRNDAAISQHDPTIPIIWANGARTLGLRVRVKQRKWKRDAPVLIHKDEDQAVIYSLEIE